MFNSLTAKFTFFYWITFFVVAFPLYIFGTIYMKNILQNTEHEKVELMVNTLKPTIAINLSFNQDLEVQKILRSIFREKNIVYVELKSEHLEKSFSKEEVSIGEVHTYESTINDPFNAKEIATIKVTHSFEYLLSLYNKITTVLIFIFLFALVVFLSFYLSMKKELDDLRAIAKAFETYSLTKHTTIIEARSKTSEITTITSTANEMIKNISLYLNELEHFNTNLESEIKEKVNKLHDQEKMMVHQSRQAAMGEMLESIAHQWRQPLNIIGLSCVNLELEHNLGITDDKNFKDKMQIISTNINYMSNTIDDFRNFLNPDVEATHFKPAKTIEAVYEILSAQLEHNHVKLSIIGDKNVELFGVENEFKQIVFILINNSKDAIKSLQTQTNVLDGKIEVHIFRDNKNNIVSFCDNGGGIKEEIMHSIFNPYFTTKFASSGTGIGLYMVKNIIESRMKGTISVKNTIEGCCFKITQNQNPRENR